MPKTYYTSSVTKTDRAGIKHLRAIRRTEANDRAVNWRLSQCGTCEGEIFYYDNRWWHEEYELDNKHPAMPKVVICES